MLKDEIIKKNIRKICQSKKNCKKKKIQKNKDHIIQEKEIEEDEIVKNFNSKHYLKQKT